MKTEDYAIIMVGRIVSYSPANQTSTIRICDDRTSSNSQEDDVQTERGLLYNVPTYTSGGGGWHLTFPIKAGDSCLLNFSQFGYDHWLVEDKDRAGVRDDGLPQPWTRRRFDLSDGFAQVGFNNLLQTVADYSETDVELRNDDRTQRLTLLEDGNIHIASGASTVNIAPDGNVTIVAPTVAVTGDMTVSGTIVATGEITGNGIELSTHTHTEQGDGNATSPPN